MTLEELDRCREEASVMLQKILRMESDPLFTQNSDVLEAEEKKWYQDYYSQKYPKPQTLSNYSGSGRSPSYSTSPGVIHFFPTEPYGRTLTDCPQTWTVEDEVKVMANVQAYFQVAYKRIIDYVPLMIEHELNQSFATGLSNALVDRIFDNARRGKMSLEDLVKEDPLIAAKRNELEDRKNRLLLIQEKLNTFWQSGSLAISRSPSPSPSLESYRDTTLDLLPESYGEASHPSSPEPAHCPPTNRT